MTLTPIFRWREDTYLQRISMEKVMRDKVKRFVMYMALALASVGLVIAPAYVQGAVTPPNLNVCGVTILRTVLSEG